MADTTNGGAGSGLYFIVGGLVVVVGLLAFLFFGGHIGGRSSPSKVDITIQAPKTSP
jgi:hypothetical protein